MKSRRVNLVSHRTISPCFLTRTVLHRWSAEWGRSSRARNELVA